MAAIFSSFLNSPFSLPPPSTIFLHSSSSSLSRTQILASSSSSSSSSSSASASFQMDSHNDGRTRYLEFPYVSAPVKNLMAELVSTVESRLDSNLLPCSLPQDVQYYQNQTGTSHASLQIRSGRKTSPIDFILGSWIHCEIPSRDDLNITSLSAYLNPSTDAPHFLFELIQSSPTSVILILDLPPRKDLVLHPDYLKTFYEDTQLEGQRQQLAKIPEVTPYFSSLLYLRCAVSPTAIMVRIETEAGEQTHMDEIIHDHVSPVAKEVLGIWLDRCATGDREVGESESAFLKERDGVLKSKTIEVDLSSSLPRLFGPEIAGRVIAAIHEIFNT